MTRWNLKPETKAAFTQFKREYETEMKLANNLSQDDFVQLLNKYKTQILDVLVNAETILSAENSEKGQVLA
jgi:hypothetical protein